MNIALIAHDAEKELMVQFCIAYCGFYPKTRSVRHRFDRKVVAEATVLKSPVFFERAR
jgi:methylglyoxal synthase